MSDYKGCLSESSKRGIKNKPDLCRKEEQNYPKSIEPKSAKKGTCLWMFQNKKWNNLGCMETQALCKYAEKQYKSQAKVECR